MAPFLIHMCPMDVRREYLRRVENSKGAGMRAEEEEEEERGALLPPQKFDEMRVEEEKTKELLTRDGWKKHDTKRSGRMP